MTGQQLKNSILQLAVQGKLVPQDPADEPASQLLARIREEKEQLIREKKIKREKNPSQIFRGDGGHFYERVGKNEPVCIDEELPFEIPETWEWARFSSVIDLQSGQDLTPEKYNSSQIGIPYITGASNIENGNVIINRWTNNGRAFAYQHDLLLTCKGTVGTMAILQEPKVHIARQIMAIRPYNGLKVLYLKLVLETLIADLKAAAKSMIPGISRNDVLTALVPLPPLAEQQRIVAKIEELLPFVARYEQSQNKLEKLNTTFPDQLRKFILQEAIQGKLVPQNSADEPASILLERIRAEKAQLIKEGKIKREKNPSQIFRSEDGHFYERSGKNEPVCIDDQLPFEIPETWEWARLGTCLDVRDGTHDTPKYVENGIPLITSKNLKNGQIDFTTAKMISFEDHYIISQRSKVERDDILFAMIGSIGNPVLYTGNKEFSIKNMALFKKVSGGANMGYILLYLKIAQENMKKESSGGVQSFVSLKYLRNYLIPLPPLAEQQRIVAKLEQLDVFIAQLTKS